MASTSSLCFSHSLIKALLCSSFFISAWFIYLLYYSYLWAASSLKFDHWSFILSSCFWRLCISTFPFSSWSSASLSFNLSSVIWSLWESRMACCFSRRAVISRSCLSFRSLDSCCKVSSNLWICLKYWASFNLILSLSRLASSILLLLSLARF